MEVGGSRYRMTCGLATGCDPKDGTKYWGTVADQKRTLDDCLQACADIPGCNSINWLNTDCKSLSIVPSVLQNQDHTNLESSYAQRRRAVHPQGVHTDSENCR